MPLPKVTRFVRDGEVDPGVRNMAMAMRRELLTMGDGITPAPEVRDRMPADVRDDVEKSIYWLDVMSYRIASRGIGLYTTANFSEFLPEVNTGFTAWIANLVDKPDARRLMDRLLENEPERDLIVEALMFFDPSGLLAARLDKKELTLDDVIYLAKATASSVPPLGRKWIAAELVKDGVPALEALARASDVYRMGGDYFSFMASFERSKEIGKILREVDPNVTDEEVALVANSPLTVDAVRSTMGVEAQPKEETSGGLGLVTSAALSAGAGWLAASAFGGPVGLAVGGAFFLATRLLGGK